MLQRSLAAMAMLAIFAVIPQLHAANTGQAVGTGINSIRNWGTSVPFVDLFKSARIDPVTASKYNVINPALTPALPSGDYIVRYEGTGSLTYGGSGILDAAASQPGRDVINFDTSTNVFLDITVVGTVENIRVTLPGGICAADPATRVDASGDCSAGDYLAFEAYPEDILFNPDFLAFTKPFRVLRYMDFMETNGSTVVQWSDRTLLTDEVWSGEAGAPIEVMVELANRADANPWFTLPHRADNNYVTEFARYVRDNLNPNLKAYIEYSNETWSPGNIQGQYVRTQGLLMFPTITDPNRAGGMFYAQRSLEIFDIWETEFGGLDRIVRSLSGQLVNPWLSGIILDHAASISDDPSATTIDADVFGVNAYISGDLTYFRNEAQTVADIFAEMRNPARTKLSLPPQVGFINDHIALTDALSINLVAYEGGQALVDFTTTSDLQHPNPLFFAANRDPEMKVMYGEILDAWKNSTATLFVHFSAPTVFNKSGSWGVKEFLTQATASAPKFDALMTFLNNNTCWWANCVGTAGGTTAPVASFTSSSNELDLVVDATGSTDADGSIRSYLWNYGDGNTGSGATASHTYAQPGNYDVTLVTFDNNNNASTLTKQVTITSSLGQPPVAAFTATPNGLSIGFDATASSDADGSIVSYSWDFGDTSTGTGATTSHTYATPGDYTVTLTVTDDSSLTDQASEVITVSTVVTPVAPVAAFTVTQTVDSISVDATGSSDDGTITSYDWDFGDGNTGTGVTASHTYTTAGDYTVTLTVTDDDALTNATTQQVTIAAQNTAPTAAFTFTENGLTVEVDGSSSTDSDGSIASYTWDFGDGGTATGPTASHEYSAAGTYTVTLTVADDGGLDNATSQDVTAVVINQAPVASFSLDQVDLMITVDASTSTDDSGITGYEWDFGDGTTVSGITASHAYATDGTYTVSLTVTDGEGLTDSSDAELTVSAPVVNNVSPAATFTMTDNGLEISLDATGSSDADGTIASYAWDFDDGTTASGATATHTYASDGSYNVSLTVTDNDGGMDTTSQTVTVAAIVPVNQAPVADFTTTVDMLRVEVNAANSSDSDGSITDYDWDFGDGTSGTGPSLSHSYATAGDYTISLTVTDDGGETNTTTKAITVSSVNTTASSDGGGGGSFGLFWLLLMGFVYGHRFRAAEIR